MNEEGVIDMPMRLMIIAAILVITVPMVLAIVQYYSAVSSENQLTNGIEYLKKQMQIVFSQGENASMVVRVTFPYGTEFVKIGGPLDTPQSQLIRYKMINGVVRYTVVNYGNIGIRMMSKDGGTLFVVGGTYDFILTKLKSPIDLDGDGIANDFYIQVSLREG